MPTALLAVEPILFAAKVIPPELLPDTKATFATVFAFPATNPPCIRTNLVPWSALKEVKTFELVWSITVPEEAV
jgi:hypothetical protein